MRKRKALYKARRWVNGKARRERRNLHYAFSFAGLQPETKEMIIRTGGPISSVEPYEINA